MRVRPTLGLERAGVRSIVIFRLGGRFGQAHGEAGNDRSLDVGARRLRMFEHFGTRYRRLHLVPRHQVAQRAEIFVIDVNFHWDTPARKDLAKILFLLFDGGTGSPGCAGSGHTSISKPASAAARHPPIPAISPASDPTAPAAPIRLAFDRVGKPGHWSRGMRPVDLGSCRQPRPSLGRQGGKPGRSIQLPWRHIEPELGCQRPLIWYRIAHPRGAMPGCFDRCPHDSSEQRRSR